MRRSLRFATTALVSLAVAACADVPTTSVPRASMHSGSFAAVTPGTCTTLGQLNTLAAAMFVTGQPNVQSVLGKLKNLDQLVKKGKIADAQARAHEIVDFTLMKNAQRALGGTDAQLDAFLDAVYCFAGIDVEIEEPDNTFLIMPSDEPQVVTDTTGTGGISFDAFPVLEPTLIEFELLPDDFAPGGGPLETKLDQYPGFLQITKTSETDAALARPAVVGVCATGVIPQEVRDRLRLGHGKATGFEIAPPASADFLTCENLVASAGPDPLWRRLASLVAPKALHASTAAFFGGGVGGTVTEFSPFAPVDPVISFSGGVGGTVTEFVREGPATVDITTAATDAMITDCSVGAAGTQVAPECRPTITIRTRLGTLLTGVPVLWQVTLGDGAIAPRTTFCGTNGTTASTTTNALGQAAICWLLGTGGANAVRAIPGSGGDAPSGVVFTPEDTTFTVDASLGQPTVIEIVSGDGQVGSAGGVLAAPVVVRVTDSQGNPKAGIPVTWVVMDGGGSIQPVDLTTDGDGLARANWTLGSPGENRMKAVITSYIKVQVFVTATALP